jgi:arylsulfatase A-like enzyme
MQTGRFAPVNRVTQTLLWPGLVHQDRKPNIASLLKEKAGYEVVWKGKWHLSWAGGHIRAVREGDWTYAVYFGLDGSGLDYELYNVKSDPGQLHNLLYQRPAATDVKEEWLRLHRFLTARLVEVANLPDSFSWPIEPVGV